MSWGQGSSGGEPTPCLVLGSSLEVEGCPESGPPLCGPHFLGWNLRGWGVLGLLPFPPCLEPPPRKAELLSGLQLFLRWLLQQGACVALTVLPPNASISSDGRWSEYLFPSANSIVFSGGSEPGRRTGVLLTEHSSTQWPPRMCSEACLDPEVVGSHPKIPPPCPVFLF